MSVKCPKCQADNPDTQSFCGNCGTNLSVSEEISAPTKTIETPTEELKRGSVFAGRYEIIEELGKGGMGKVYRVEDTKVKEEIALKLIKPEIAADKKTIERFRNELKIARKIRHKNVCAMFDLSEEKGSHFITMEYVSGGDLKKFIRRSGQMGVGKAISIAKQICDGLEEAHSLGIVHRDLKPNNIMIDDNGNARIMDFGIARTVKEKGITGSGVMIGTPEYMSPEQVEAKEVDQRSDIYSIGIIMYEMLTGRLPFEADTAFAVGMKHKSEIPKSPKEYNSQISDDLNRVILKCLEKDKENRYQDAGKVRSELEKIEQGLPTTDRVIPKKKTLTSQEITVQFSLKKIFIPAFVVIAIVIIGLIIWSPWSQKTLTPIPSDRPSLAILYFKNNTGDKSLDHWRSALSDLLITDLTQSKYIRVLSEDKLFTILSEMNLLDSQSYSSKVLRQVASQGRVNHILQGNYTRAGETFRINITIQEADSGELIDSDSIEGKGEESFYSMVDELTRRVKTILKFSEQEIEADIDREVVMITTSSSEAYKYYIEGRKFLRMGEWDQCIQLFKRAVAIDPEFALAYSSMAMAYYNTGNASEEITNRRKAIDLAEHLSDREKFLVQAEYYRISEITYDKAIEAYTNLLQLYPEDWTGNNYLGNLYMFIEEWEKAIESLDINVQNRVEAVHSYANISRVYMSIGLYDRAQEVLENYLENISDNYIIRDFLALNYASQGKFDLALGEMEKSFYLFPTKFYSAWMRGGVFQLKGDLITAAKEYMKFLESEDKIDHLSGYRYLMNIHLQEGKLEKSKEFAERGIELARELGQKIWEESLLERLGYLFLTIRNPGAALEEYKKMGKIAVEEDLLDYQRSALYWKGIAYLEINSIAEAQRAADELKDLIEKGIFKKIIRIYYNLMGRIELKREDFPLSIEYFQRAIDLLPSEGDFGFGTARYFDSLALAYYKLGDWEKAREEYEKIIRLTTGRVYYGDIYAKSFYMLGKIYEQQGNKAKAIENHDKFLTLWKDADPGLPEVEDAKKRLDGLKKE